MQPEPRFRTFIRHQEQPAVQGKLVRSKAPGFSRAIASARSAPSLVVMSQPSLVMRIILQPRLLGILLPPPRPVVSTFPTSESGAQQNSMITGVAVAADASPSPPSV